MNKFVLEEELTQIGMELLSYEFVAAGYVIEIKLNPDASIGWEKLENLPIIGIEMAKFKDIGAYARQVLFIPTNDKEFKDYVRKHMKLYGQGREGALCDLRETIGKFGSRHTKIFLEEYLNKTSRKKKN